MQKRFSNLDGLRFISAWIIIIVHFEVFKVYFGLSPQTGRFFSNSGQIAVTFFFELSGLLIAYLLFKEKKRDPKERIALARFYKRRIARIWPLYYFLVLLTFFVLRHLSFFQEFPVPTVFADNTHAGQRFLGYLFFLPNYTEYRFGSQLYLGQTWTLGVEEFFYLIFPLLIYITPYRKINRLMVILAAIFILLTVAVHSNLTGDLNENLKSVLRVYLDKYRIYSFAIGGLAAFYLLEGNYRGSRPGKILSSRCASWVLLFITVILVISGTTFGVFTQPFYAILFGLLLFSFITSEIRFQFLNYPWMVYFGKISYGIYMFHAVAIVTVLRLAGRTGGFSTISNFLYMLAATVLTILIATVSYELFERIFLKRREGFSGSKKD